MSYGLRFETVSEDLIGPYIELSKTEYENVGVCDRAHMSWKHLQNPQGRSLAYGLYEGDSLIGRICFQIRDFSFAGRKLRSGYLTDLLVHPRHRGMGTALRLMEKIRQVPGLDFIYVTPNAASTPLFRHALKFKQLGVLSVLGFPVRSRVVFSTAFSFGTDSVSALVDVLIRLFIRLGQIWIGRRPEGLRLTEERPSDVDTDALIHRLASVATLKGRRDAQFHNWRFHESPFNKYRVQYIYHHGELAGYVATRSESYLGYRTLFIVDVCFDERIDASRLRHIKFSLLEQAFRERCDLVLGIFMRENPALAQFCSFPLLKIPARFLPQEVDMFVEPLDLAKELTVDPAQYYVTLADLDVF